MDWTRRRGFNKSSLDVDIALTKVYRDIEFYQERDALRYAVSAINTNLARKRFDHLNEILGKLDPSRLSATLINAFARQTYTTRQFMDNWEGFVKRSLSALKDRDYPNPEKVLVGLLPIEPAEDKK